MTLNPYKLIKYHLYLLQLENYELGRFWKLLLGRGWFPPVEQRKNLVWTKKAVLLFVLSEITILLLAGLLAYLGFRSSAAFLWQRLLVFLLIIYILSFFTPILLSLSVVVLWPFDFVAKLVIVSRAKKKIARFGNLKVIAIAGSYGKTTMKEILAAVLSSSHFKVLATPESVNTPVGIARWILNKVDESVNIIIVEMGEHYKGDILELCWLVLPDIAVITGINEAHLERMGTVDNIVTTIFEVAEGAKSEALVMINQDDSLVVDNYLKYVKTGQKVITFGIGNLKSRSFNREKLLWNAEAEGVGNFELNLLGEYGLADVAAAVKIAQSLGMNNQQIPKGIANIQPVEHRLQPIKSAGNILIIDDAYNGNPAGAAEAIKVLSRFSGHRKIYITPGLVETGESAEQVHQEIGRQLAAVADVVILIKNSVTPWIAEGMKTPNKIMWFNSAQEAHSSLGKILQPYDVVLFQNDWGDNYL